MLDLSNWNNNSSFEILSLDNIFINGHYLKNVECHVHWKLQHVAIQYLHDCHLQWNSYSKSFNLNSCTLSIFPAPEIKKLFVGKILRRFDTVLHIWLIHLYFSLDIPVMIKFHTKWLKFCTRKCLMQYICIDSMMVHQGKITH